MDDARRSIQRLTIKTSPTSTDEAVALIQHTIKIEEETQQGSSYVDCFKGVNLRRTEIACMTFAAQIWCGSPLGGAPTYFLVNAGLSAANAFKFSLGGLGLASLGTIISWGLLSRFGRRTLYVYGLAMLFVTLIITGSVSAGAGNGSTSSYIQGGFVIGWLLVYYLTVGPVCYAIISEISAVNLRNKSVCLSRISYYLCQVIGSVIEPYMVNPNNANWRGKTAFFWAGTCLLFFIWAYFRLPESKDLSYEQLDILFNEHVGARHFSKMKVDAYAPKGERVKRA